MPQRAVHAQGAARLDGEQPRSGHASRAGQTVTESFQVTAPSNAAPGTRTLTRHGDSRRTADAGDRGVDHDRRAVRIAGRRLQQHRDQRQLRREPRPTTTASATASPPQALAAGTPTALTPGRQVTIGGHDVHVAERAGRHARTTWSPPARPSTSAAAGTDLGFLGASQNGTASGIVTIHYTDGSSQSFNLNMADWYANAPAVGNQLVTTTSSWNFQSNPLGPHPVSVYFASVPLEHGKTVSSVTLPDPDRRRRDHRDAHLRDGDRERDPDDRRAVLVARRRVRQRRDQRQLRSRRRPTSTAPARASRRRRWRPARRRRSPRAARRRSAAPRSPGRPPSARPTT